MAIGGDLLMGPMLLGAVILGGLAVGANTVNHLEPITVTARMEQLGLSSAAVTEHLVTRVAQVADIDTEFHEIGAKDIAGDGFVESVAGALGIVDTVLAARRLPGAIMAEFQPEFIERDSGTVLRLGMTWPRTGVHLVQEFKVEGDGFDPVLHRASRSILVVIDPVTLAMDDLWRGDLVAARESVEKALRVSGGQQRQTAEMLLGIRQMAESDPVSAERTLRATLWRGKSFGPAYLALATAKAQNKDIAGARAVLAELDRQAAGAGWPSRAAREIPAAVAYIRGRLAGSEGDWEAAVGDLRRATEAVPTFAAAHHALAEAYLARREAPFTEYHAETASRLTAPDVPRFDDHLDHPLELAVNPLRKRAS